MAIKNNTTTFMTGNKFCFSPVYFYNLPRMQKSLHIIGGGLAGCEAAWQAAEAGIQVTIHEMRTENRKTEAHLTDTLAELVCSNSFRSDDAERNAVGLLHQEMRRLGSIIMKCADANKVPAGGALAMDRVAFSTAVQNAIENHKNIKIIRDEITELPPEDFGKVIIATGPLTSTPLAESIRKVTGEEHLAFFDAIAPIVFKDSINFDICWYQSRYDKGDGKDYINCPMTKEEYFAFIDALLAGEKTDFKEWEKNTPYFEGCLPIEVMAERGVETLRYGPMKPVGLTNPHFYPSPALRDRVGVRVNPNISPSPNLSTSGGEELKRKPYAIVQLRQDNKIGTLYNMVGFQTKLKYGAQEKIFRTIPGLEKAEFARLGGIHRNTFINSPKLLDNTMRLKKIPHIRFAGQVTGVEGYVESAAMGLLAGRFAASEIAGEEILTPPITTALGALLNHITGGHKISEEEKGSFQPMNVNFGLFPDLKTRTKKTDRKLAYTSRAKADLEAWINFTSDRRAVFG